MKGASSHHSLRFKRLFAGHILKQRRLDNSASGSFEWSQQSWSLVWLASSLVLSNHSKDNVLKSRWSHSFVDVILTGKAGQARQVLYAITAALFWMDIPGQSLGSGSQLSPDPNPSCFSASPTPPRRSCGPRQWRLSSCEFSGRRGYVHRLLVTSRCAAHSPRHTPGVWFGVFGSLVW